MNAPIVLDWKNQMRENSRLALKYLQKPFLAASAIALVDSFALSLILRRVPSDYLALTLFFQGGLGLIIGVGISLSSTPSVSNVSERLFGTSPWSRDAEKHAERVGWKWRSEEHTSELQSLAYLVCRLLLEKKKKKKIKT